MGISTRFSVIADMEADFGTICARLDREDGCFDTPASAPAGSHNLDSIRNSNPGGV